MMSTTILICGFHVHYLDATNSKHLILNDPYHAAHTLPKTLPKILVLAWHKEE